MTYLELYEQANYELEHSLITLGEYEKRIKPLEEEVRQTGHWIKDEEMSIMFDIWVCSECGSGGGKHFKYYPCCGAKMEGEDKLTCDRNICLKNEYNNIGCEDCVVTKGENK